MDSEQPDTQLSLKEDIDKTMRKLNRLANEAAKNYGQLHIRKSDDSLVEYTAYISYAGPPEHPPIRCTEESKPQATLREIIAEHMPQRAENEIKLKLRVETAIEVLAEAAEARLAAIEQDYRIDRTRFDSINGRLAELESAVELLPQCQLSKRSAIIETAVKVAVTSLNHAARIVEGEGYQFKVERTDITVTQVFIGGERFQAEIKPLEKDGS